MECDSTRDTGNNRGDWNQLKSFRQYLSNITGKHEIKELKRKAILGIAHILRKVLMRKCKTFNMGNSIHML